MTASLSPVASLCLDPTAISEGDMTTASTLSAKFSNAKPFPYLVIDNFLADSYLLRLVQASNAAPDSSSMLYNGGYSGFNKYQFNPLKLPHADRTLIESFNSSPFLLFLEALTSLSGLLPDPSFEGAGFHHVTHGGYLGIHKDFSLLKPYNLARRINLIIYLTPEWRESYGGKLGLWQNPKMPPIVSILPVFHRAVIFRTDLNSYHGHPEPLACPTGIRRSSLALYYYTASSLIEEEIPLHSTIYYSRTDASADELKTAKLWQRSAFLVDWSPPVLRRIVRRIKSKASQFFSKP